MFISIDKYIQSIKIIHISYTNSTYKLYKIILFFMKYCVIYGEIFFNKSCIKLIFIF